MKHSWKVVLPLLLVLVLLITGCGSGNGKTANPEDAVSAFWAAFAGSDFEKAAEYVVNDKADEVKNIKNDLQSDGLFDEEMTQLLFSRFKVQTTGHSVNGNTATVDAVITYPNLDYVFGEFFTLAFELMLSGDEPDEAALEALFFNAFKDLLNESEDLQENFTLDLVLEEGRWKISDMPDLGDL